MAAEDSVLDMSTVIQLLEEAIVLAKELDGAHINVERSNDRAVMKRSSENSKSLLYGVHVIDCARVAMTSQYHLFRGQNPPIIALP